MPCNTVCRVKSNISSSYSNSGNNNSSSSEEEEEKGECVQLLEEGEEGCERDRDCAGWEAGMRCAEGVCAAGRVLGEACATDDDCELPLVCDRARLVCAKPWADLGEACAAGPCLLSFVCDHTDPAGPVCARRARHREQCDAAAGCEYPYTCAGYCTDLRHARGLGDPCASTADCAEGLLCVARVCAAPADACGAGALPRCRDARDVCVLPHAPANATAAQHAEDFMLCIDANAFHWSNCAEPFLRLLAAFGSAARWHPCAPCTTVRAPAPPNTEPSSAPVTPESAAASSVSVTIVAFVLIALAFIMATTSPG